MKVEDFKELKNFLPPDTPIDIETQIIKIKDFEKALASFGGSTEEVHRIVVVHIEHKVLEGFADSLVNWAKDINTKKINKSIIIDFAKSAHTIKTSTEYASGTITIINKAGRLSKHYSVIYDQISNIKEAILDVIQNPSIYPIKYPTIVPAI